MTTGQFNITGINYKKTEVGMRGHFAVNNQQYFRILKKAAEKNISGLFVLSTCNRTEIYGLASPKELIELLCSETEGSIETFSELCYIKSGWDAAEHLFNVGAGLDSQILGDYEIVGQLKLAVKFARENNMIDPFMERLVNTVLQSSKAIKTQTQLSGGTVSVAFAAVQFIKEKMPDAANKKIVLIGTGKIGRNTCKNLVDYLDTKNITLVNRTDEKAEELAAELGLSSIPFSEAKKVIEEADVIVVATNSQSPVIFKQDVLQSSNRKILIDLSVPYNIDVAVKELPYVTLANVDDLATINDNTLQMRMAEVPKARGIIVNHIHEFAEWYTLRRNVPALKAAKQKMLDMQHCHLFIKANKQANNNCSHQHIQKVINNMAIKMRTQHQPGCFYIQAINDFISANAV